MKRVKYEIPVGILFTIAMGFLIYYTIIMSHKILKPKDTYKTTVVFQNISGLIKTDKVKINGVLSGSIEEITLNDGYVLVELKMFNKFTLYENYTIKINSDSIMAGKQVSIYPGSSKGKNGNEFEVIETREMLKGSVEDPMASIARFIDDNRGNVYATIKNLKEITGKINNGKGTMGRLINEDTIHNNTDHLLKDMNEAIEDSREQAPITSFLRAALSIF